MQRRFLLRSVVVGALILACVVGVTELLPRRPAFSWDTVSKIEAGMHEEEVHGLLGGPPGDYRTRIDGFMIFRGDCETDVSLLLSDPDVRSGKRFVRVEEWLNNDGRVRVGFNAEGQVLAAESKGFIYAGPDFLTTLRRWLGL
jgi:hypothetical protein